MTRGETWERKGYLNQFKNRYTAKIKVMLMEVLYNTFDVPIPQEINSRYSSKERGSEKNSWK